MKIEQTFIDFALAACPSRPVSGLGRRPPGPRRPFAAPAGCLSPRPFFLPKRSPDWCACHASGEHGFVRRRQRRAGPGIRSRCRGTRPRRLPWNVRRPRHVVSLSMHAPREPAMLNLDQTYDFQGQAVDWGRLDGPADSAPMVLIHGFPGRRRPGAGDRPAGLRPPDPAVARRIHPGGPGPLRRPPLPGPPDLGRARRQHPRLPGPRTGRRAARRQLHGRRRGGAHGDGGRAGSRRGGAPGRPRLAGVMGSRCRADHAYRRCSPRVPSPPRGRRGIGRGGVHAVEVRGNLLP